MKHVLCVLLMVLMPPLSAPLFAQMDSLEIQPRLECLGQRVIEFSRDPVIIAGVNNYNTSPPDPHRLDTLWPTLKPGDIYLDAIINHPSAQAMRDWIKRISIQGEGLLIGRNGGLVAATEKTTDFWQGDEAQYLQAIGLPEGKVYVQSEMLDESTHLMLIKISAPIYNPRSTRAIGVLVIGFDQFVIDFSEPCKNVQP
ncbi:PDC sensor domain-containing protein [Ketobacter sp.]|uniref:PDC sensor domain-containing protein n=1 Tax=Ketobacter sp. TaxID=2083498 RepID=UPI0025BD506F|nr:PDC sensor domain-containing protein [Ketobacter sp.]